MSSPMKFFVHKKTVRYTDYGEHLQTVTGICWSSDGENTMGFEEGKTVAGAIARMTEFGGAIEIVEGREITRTCDYNPHGLI